MTEIFWHAYLKDLLNEAPVWWGSENKEIYDNLIFVMPSTKAEIIAEKIGEPTKELEQIYICKSAIFWSFDRKKYGNKTRCQQEISFICQNISIGNLG